MEKAPTALGTDLSQLELYCSPEIRLDMNADALAAATTTNISFRQSPRYWNMAAILTTTSTSNSRFSITLVDERHADTCTPPKSPRAPLKVMKFSRSYCADLHSLCSERGRAPKLLGFQRLPGGWFAIAMEYLSDAIGIAQVPFSDHWIDGILCDKAQLLAHFKSELTELVDGFHKEGFVHGDLRCANILSNKSGDEVWLIDFDWGGRDGEAHYPIWNLNKDLQTGRLSKTLDISKKDDTRILRAALRQLEDLRTD